MLEIGQFSKLGRLEPLNTWVKLTKLIFLQIVLLMIWGKQKKVSHIFQCFFKVQSRIKSVRVKEEVHYYLQIQSHRGG